MNLIRGCLASGRQEDYGEFLDNSGKYCHNKFRGQVIDFLNPGSLKAALTEHLEFTVTKGDPCFTFKGKSEEFSIESPEHGLLSVKKVKNGDLLIQCFNNEVMSISKEVQVNGCNGISAKPFNFIPRATLLPLPAGERKGLTFHFHGPW